MYFIVGYVFIQIQFEKQSTRYNVQCLFQLGDYLCKQGFLTSYEILEQYELSKESCIGNGLSGTMTV